MDYSFPPTRSNRPRQRCVHQLYKQSIITGYLSILPSFSLHFLFPQLPAAKHFLYQNQKALFLSHNCYLDGHQPQTLCEPCNLVERKHGSCRKRFDACLYKVDKSCTSVQKHSEMLIGEETGQDVLGLRNLTVAPQSLWDWHSVCTSQVQHMLLEGTSLPQDCSASVGLERKRQKPVFF